MRIAAYQAPLLAAGSMEALGLIRTQVERCEGEGVTILCCPEAILGGLADCSRHPNRFAIATGRLDSAFALIASDTVTTIIGFTELEDEGRLYNSAEVFQGGSVVGLYRKLYPAINHARLPGPSFRASAAKAGVWTYQFSSDTDNFTARSTGTSCGRNGRDSRRSMRLKTALTGSHE